MKPAQRRKKGHDFERRIARDLREIYPEAKRGLKQTRFGEGADVEIPRFFIEAKHQKKCNFRAAYKQACDNLDDDRMPIAICKDNRVEPLVILSYEDFLAIVRELEQLQKE